MSQTEPRRARKPAPAPKKKRRSFGYCRQCGERFEKARKWQEFCSTEHRLEFHHKGGPSFDKYRTLMQTELRRNNRRILKAVTDQLRTLLKRLVKDDQLSKEAIERFRQDIEAQLGEPAEA